MFRRVRFCFGRSVTFSLVGLGRVRFCFGRFVTFS